MSLINDIKEKSLDEKKLSRFSLSTIRVVIEACNCPKDNLCTPCKNLLKFYKWKTQENEKYTKDATEWIMHQCCLIFYGPDYKKHKLYFTKDIYSLRTVVELYKEYLKEVVK